MFHNDCWQAHLQKVFHFLGSSKINGVVADHCQWGHVAKKLFRCRDAIEERAPSETSETDEESEGLEPVEMPEGEALSCFFVFLLT